MIALAAMQGMGKPGSNIWATTQGAPCDEFFFPGYAEGGISGDCENSAAGFRWLRMFDGTGSLPTVNTHDSPRACHPPPAHSRGHHARALRVERQGFLRRRHPAPDAQVRVPGAGLPLHQHVLAVRRLVHRHHDGDQPLREDLPEGKVGSSSTSPSGSRARPFADIILPACTNFERWDISEFANCSGYIPDNYNQCNHRVISLQKKCIEPLGESKSDYDIFAAVAERMGIGDIFTEGGKDEYDWCKQYFDATDLPKYITWEEFKKKGYFVVPMPEPQPKPALRWFAEGRESDTPDWGPRPGDTVGLEGPADDLRQDRVRELRHQAPRDGRGRPGASRHGRSTSRAGRATTRASSTASTRCSCEPAPALQLPHHGRLQGQLAERRQGPSRPARGRALLLGHAR